MGKGKVILLCMLIVLTICFIAYLYVMALLEDPIVIKNSSIVKTNIHSKEISFSPLLSLFISNDEYSCHGIDNEGNEYTHFSASLSPLFEESEVHYIVNWTTLESTLYLGEGRAMDRINLLDYQYITWY